MLVNTKEMLLDALRNKYAVGAFNFSNMEILNVIVEVANEEGVPCIIQVTESTINYMGMDYLLALVNIAVENSKVPLALHLDHGKTFEICRLCIEKGFSSVMIDNSNMNFEDNVKFTREVVKYASNKGVTVEAELGTLSGVEDNVKVLEKNSFLTSPIEAGIFVEKTGVDSLAVAIGTSHGPNKGKNDNPKLDIGRLIEIKKIVGESFPLVLHGAS